jgi:mono/diheme cytochrome c family protein
MNFTKTLFIFTLAFTCEALAQSDKVARGKYLVSEVAKCQDCHTPKASDGKLDQEKWLKGAVLDFQPLEPVKGWHKTSPDLTSTGRLWGGRWGEAALVKLLSTGLGPTGKPADVPMPTYKMNQEDAEAVVAYLKSLK